MGLGHADWADLVVGVVVVVVVKVLIVIVIVIVNSKCTFVIDKNWLILYMLQHVFASKVNKLILNYLTEQHYINIGEKETKNDEINY